MTSASKNTKKRSAWGLYLALSSVAVFVLMAGGGSSGRTLFTPVYSILLVLAGLVSLAMIRRRDSEGRVRLNGASLVGLLIVGGQIGLAVVSYQVLGKMVDRKHRARELEEMNAQINRDVNAKAEQIYRDATIDMEDAIGTDDLEATSRKNRERLKEIDAVAKSSTGLQGILNRSLNAAMQKWGLVCQEYDRKVQGAMTASGVFVDPIRLVSAADCDLQQARLTDALEANQKLTSILQDYRAFLEAEVPHKPDGDALNQSSSERYSVMRSAAIESASTKPSNQTLLAIYRADQSVIKSVSYTHLTLPTIYSV